MTRPLSIVILGLSLSSAWGNGHATTYRALIRGLEAEGHDVLFLEREQSWYAENRDLKEPDFCRLEFYSGLRDLRRFEQEIRTADAVIIGSYVAQGVELIEFIASLNPPLLCFYDIDTPVTLKKLDEGDEEYLSLRQMPLFDIYFSFAGGEVLSRLENTYRARRAAPLYCSVDAARYRNSGEPKVWDLGYLGTYSADRQPAIERLLIEPARRLPNQRFVVAGPQYPSDIDWPANVERIEHLPPAEHASFYSRQRFTLNVTRAPMVLLGWSPSVRLFEAAACGTPIISDRWKGLGDILPLDEAILVADDADDVVHALQSIEQADVDAIANEARRIVLAKHTGEARARELAAAVYQERVRRGAVAESERDNDRAQTGMSADEHRLQV